MKHCPRFATSSWTFHLLMWGPQAETTNQRLVLYCDNQSEIVLCPIIIHIYLILTRCHRRSPPSDPDHIPCIHWWPHHHPGADHSLHHWAEQPRENLSHGHPCPEPSPVNHKHYYTYYEKCDFTASSIAMILFWFGYKIEYLDRENLKVFSFKSFKLDI